MNTEERKLFNDFAEDAFLEIDENLQKIKTELIEFEKFIGQEKISKKILNNMLIPFHTIKGISGMVGLSEIQNISHSVEHFIKFLIEEKIKLVKEAVDGIYDSVKLIESILVIYKEGKLNLLPSYKQEMDRIIDLMFDLAKKETGTTTKETVTEKTALPKEVDDLIKDYIKLNKKIYSIKFKPSQELYLKGITINKLREDLSDECEFLDSRPLKDEQGTVYFNLIVATDSELETNDILKESKVILTKLYSPTEEAKEQEEPKPEPVKQISDYQKFSLSNVVRLELSKIDELITMLGDLVIARAKFDLSLQNFASKLDDDVYRTLSEINLLMERKIRALREGIMRTRLVPIGDIFERMKFVIHDLVRTSQKSVALELKGKDTEIDKYVVEKMFDPLLHLVRNSISHGIESPEERVKLGKNPEGKITISAYASGDSVVIEISDDGKGIDKEKVIQKAVQLNLIQAKNDISNSELLEIICSPGFSTRSEADMASGRGVGMTSVKRAVEELGGKIELQFEANKGTKFIINLPLTLAIVDAMIVEVSNHSFAIPQPNISEIIDVESSKIKLTEGFHFVQYRDQILPLIYLTEFFGLEGPITKRERNHIVIVETSGGKAGIVVDRIKTKKEIVVRALNDPLVRVEGISAATELGDGKPVLILDCPGIVSSYILKSRKLKRMTNETIR